MTSYLVIWATLRLVSSINLIGDIIYSFINWLINFILNEFNCPHEFIGLHQDQRDYSKGLTLHGRACYLGLSRLPQFQPFGLVTGPQGWGPPLLLIPN